MSEVNVRKTQDLIPGVYYATGHFENLKSEEFPFLKCKEG